MSAVVSLRRPETRDSRSYSVSVSGPRSLANEDTLACLDELGVFAVFDGMGGHANGARASALARNRLLRDLPGATALSTSFLERTLLAANADIAREAGALAQDGLGMGTTVALAWIRDCQITCLHAGDSRVYRMRDFRLDRLTHDHHREADVREHIGLGQHAVRAITRALGMGPSLKIEVTHSDWQAGDVALLTTDGVTDCLPDFRCANLIVDHLQNLSALPDALLEASTDGSDDRTVIVVPAWE